MLSDKEINEIREHLENAKNPVFFFDNDPDGLCSFLILQRFIGRGRGISLRGHSSVTKSFFKRVEELSADYIFVLDRAVFEEGFIESAKNAGIPIVGIDHHDIPKPNIEYYYNTYSTSGKTEPTSYLCYKITNRKEDSWLAVIGSIADCFMPEFIGDFKKNYPELVDYNYKSAFDIRFNTQLGKIISILSYGLFDKTANTIAMFKFLMKASGPNDILEENSKTKSFLKRYEEINKKVKSIIEKAEEHIDKKNKILYFTYGGEMAVSQPVSDELTYKYPDLIIVIGFIRGDSAKFSLRAPIDIKSIAMNAVKNIEGIAGGGHKQSCGFQMSADSAEVFRKNLLKEIEKRKEEEDED